MSETIDAPLTLTDPRVDALVSEDVDEIFHAVCHKNQIWRADPFDVLEIHEPARDLFDQLIRRVERGNGTPYGLLMLMLGDAGSGKTHLMRAFRNHVHSNHAGYCVYLQMTTAAQDYHRYILVNMMESLDDVYYQPGGDASALMTLSDALLAVPGVFTPEEIEFLRAAELEWSEVAELTTEFADRLLDQPGFDKVDGDLLRALLSLQRRNARLNQRVRKYLNCEPLSDIDAKYLPSMTARTGDGAPALLIEQLGHLIWAVHRKPLVLLVDQLEDMANQDDDPNLTRTRFNRAMQALTSISGAVSSSICVVGCLADFYTSLQNQLTASLRDRMERDPAPVRLVAERSREEIVQLVGARLEAVYGQAGVPTDDPLYPFDDAFFNRVTGMRARDVLRECSLARERLRRGEPIEPESVIEPPPAPPPTETVSQRWNDFRTSWNGIVPEGEEQQAGVLSWAIENCAADLSSGHQFSADLDGRELQVGIDHQGRPAGDKLYVAVCNKGTKGGGLGKQLAALQSRAGERTPVVVRSAEFPHSPKAEFFLTLTRIEQGGGRRVVVEDSHWRWLLALKDFHDRESHDPGYPEWRRSERPLANLKSIADILKLDGLPTGGSGLGRGEGETNGNGIGKGVDPEPVTPPPVTTLTLGTSVGLRPAPMTLEPSDLTMHAAFLGGPGSGKTTAALNLIEQLLLQEIPAILVDRKGDLGTYLTDDWGRLPEGDAELAERTRRLRSEVAVSLYTPGSAAGNDLAIPLVPPDIATLPEAEREEVARLAADSLAGMLSYKPGTKMDQATTILAVAIAQLAGVPDLPLTVKTLTEFVGQAPRELTQPLNQLPLKLFMNLAGELQALEFKHRRLLSSGGGTFSIDALVDRARHGGRTPLSVVSTKELIDVPTQQFWLAQFLTALERWGSKHPSPTLQLVVLLDEADVYLPATSKPATKRPIESLLKRGRSAGIGLFLATQSPGDFDYKCRDNVRTWLLGRITEEASLKKIQSGINTNKALIDRLSEQKAGQFVLKREGTVEQLRGQRSALVTRQLTEAEILDLARRSREGQG